MLVVIVTQAKRHAMHVKVLKHDQLTTTKLAFVLVTVVVAALTICTIITRVRILRRYH